MNRTQRHIIFIALLLLTGGAALAQNDPQFVLKRRTDFGNLEPHYLAHVKTQVAGRDTIVLQDATTFGPNCLWYSGNTVDRTGLHHNYYFMDGDTYHFLTAPLEAAGELSLHHALPAVQLLRNTEQDFYFYDWDAPAGASDGGGVARGLKHTGVDEEDCNPPDLSWGAEDGECWEVYWVEYAGSTWQLSSASSYHITTTSARFRQVTVEDSISHQTGGLTALNVANTAMEYGNNQSLSATIAAYSYFGYTHYVFEGTIHNYYKAYGASQAEDHGTSTPYGTNPSHPNGQPATWTYEWTLSGPGAAYFSFSSEAGSNVTTSTEATPTLYYNTANNTGHKDATLTLTVTYDDGAQQSLSTTVTAKTPCGNPTTLEPVVTYDHVTLSWIQTADQYKVEWKKKTGDSWSADKSDEVTTNHYTLTGLDYGTTYQYRVTAKCGANYEDTPTTPSEFTTKDEPEMLVYGAVFGGGRMADVNGSTEIVIVNCDSIGAVFGGNDIAGTVRDSAYIVLGSSGVSEKVRVHDVYGGGNGYYAYNGSTFEAADSDSRTATVAAGANVTALSESNEWNDVVWTNDDAAATTLSLPSITKTAIQVADDHVKIDSLFGGAKNAFLTYNNWRHNGDSIVIDGGTILAVYGGNNFGGGQGYGKHYIKVNHTTTNLNDSIQNTATTGYGRDFGIRYLFGGGNMVYGSTTDLYINGGQIDTVFAGGNAASVYAANVTVNCSLTAGSNTNTFGNTYSEAITSYDGTTLTVKDDYEWDGISGIYNVRTLFGGNNQASMAGVPNLHLTSGSIGTVYGGGNAGDMLANYDGSITHEDDASVITFKYGTKVELNSPTMLVDYLYGGCQMSNVDYSTWVIVNDGHVGTVYGGCNVSGDVGSTKLHPSVMSYPDLDYQAVQGATYVQATGGVVHKNLFAGGNGFYHCNDGVVYTGSPAIHYGDPEGHYIGMTIPTHNETYVLVETGATVHGNVYAGGNLAPVGFTDATLNGRPFPEQYAGLASVRMSGGTVDGDVYGGGNMAAIFGSNEVRVSGGRIGGALYGGNDRLGQMAQYANRVMPAEYDVASDGTTSLDDIRTYVGVSGRPDINTVYGGGNGAYNYNGTENGADMDYCNPGDLPIQGNTFVDIHIDGYKDGDIDGGHIQRVFGGGNGVTVTGSTTVFLNIKGDPDNSNAIEAYDQVDTIFGGNNKGDLEILADIVLKNGQVNTVYGGCNEGQMTGTFTKTLGGSTYYDIGSMVYLRSSDNATVSNAVYGGSCKNNVTHNTLVIVEGCTADTTNIFGGCDISGAVGDTARVVVKGDTMGKVFGGGNGNYSYTDALAGVSRPSCANTVVDMLGGAVDTICGGGYAAGVTANAMVNMVDGTVNHGIYGGCYSNGAINGDITVNILGGTLGTDAIHTVNIHGGGFGQPTTTNGNVTVNVGVETPATPADCPVIWGDIYGGSALGSVNDVYSGANADTTWVNFKNATIHGDIYGGGLGSADTVNGYLRPTPLFDPTEAIVNGTVVVNIGTPDQASNYDTIYGSVFGGNNLAGSPKGDIYVDVYKTAHWSSGDYNNYYHYDTDQLPSEIADFNNQEYAIDRVYGGGNLAHYTTSKTDASTYVTIHNCDNTINRVYGGGNAADVPEANVTIEGGIVYYVFGGGNGADNGIGTNPGANVNGNNYVTLNGGVMAYVFGGSDSKGKVTGLSSMDFADPNDPAAFSCPLRLVNELYGGGNQADCGDIEFTIPCGTTGVKVIYGGCRNANVGTEAAPANVHLTVKGGNMEKVFGGNNQGGIIWGNVIVDLVGGSVENLFGGSNQNGPIKGTITVNVLDTVAGCPMEVDNVYGGGNLADYAPTNASIVSPVVNILDGKVNNAVFGGGYQATVTSNPKVVVGDHVSGHSPVVGNTTLIDGVTAGAGNVFGGGEQANVFGSDTVLIVNGTINGNVYGGGQGNTTNVRDNVTVIFGDNPGTASASPVLQGDLYGGSAFGTVNTLANNDSTNVYILNGTVNGNIYGGGHGNASYAANVNGKVHVNIGQFVADYSESEYGTATGSATINGYVYGCNNAKGTPQKDVFVDVYRTAHTPSNAVDGSTFAISRVFGGGNHADYAPSGSNKIYTHIHFCDNTIETLFGGGDAAAVYGTSTEVDGGRFDRIFGGGNGEETHADINAGGAHLVIHAGQVNQYFGGSNNSGVYNGPLTSSTEPGGPCGEDEELVIGEFFGGGNFVDVDHSVTTDINCGTGKITNVYGGCNQANITGDVTLNIYGGEIENVFGGSKGRAADPEHGITAKSANISGNVTLNLCGGTITNAFGGSNINGKIDGKITINVVDTVADCHLQIDNIYGAGKNTSYRPTNPLTLSPEINILKGTVEHNIYGGGLGDTATVVANPIITIGDLRSGHESCTDTVRGNVYGGGQLATTDGAPVILIQKSNTVISGDVYGGGQGTTDKPSTSALVTKNTSVTITGGKVNNVYGGGEVASVGSGDLNDRTTGVATVTISGGEINNHVYGGGKGIDEDLANTYDNYANIDSTSVIVCDSARIYGSVFGGSANGHVWGDTRIQVLGSTKDTIPVIGTTGMSGYDGNVFGGGQGGYYNYVAGRVGGNTHVEVYDGKILGNIYGGGRLALTGAGVNGLIQDGDDHGNTKVIVKGGVIGNNAKTGNPEDADEIVIETFADFSMGNVYGGGKGDVSGLVAPHPAASALLVGLVKNTEVIIADSIIGGELKTSPHVYGIVFGGGEVSNVGKFSWTQNSETNEIYNIDTVANTGWARVTISGGIIGGDRTKMRDELISYADDGNYWTKYNDDLGYVYGGGEGISDNPNYYPLIRQGAGTTPADYTSLANLMGTVNHTQVTITKTDTIPWIKGSVFGGGEAGHVRGNTWVTISGGQIGAGDYLTKDSLYRDDQFINPLVTEIITGNSLNGTTHWDYDPTNHYPFDLVLLKQGYHPSDGKSWFGNVFGGGSGWFPYVDSIPGTNTARCSWNALSGKVWGDTHVTIEDGHILNNVYGANEATDVGGTAYIVMNGGTVGVPRTYEQIQAHPIACSIFGGGAGDARPIADTINNVTNTNVQINGGIVYCSVFGGAEDGHVTGNTTVSINEANSLKPTVIGSAGRSGADGNVFGGGRNFFGENTKAGRVGGNITLTMSSGTVQGSVFGGGRYGVTGIDKNGNMIAGNDHGNVTVTISGGTVGNPDYIKACTFTNGYVFGSGKGALHNVDLARTKNTEVNIHGDARVYGSVYGGGELASVGWINEGNYVANTGYTSVNISGGTIGMDNMKMYDPEDDSYLPDDFGHVFGGGRGMTADTTNATYALIPQLANTNVSWVTVSDTAFILGSVYGGSENGHVFDSTYVQIQGGQIGCGAGYTRPYTEAEFTPATYTAATTLAECASWPYDGPTGVPHSPLTPSGAPVQGRDGHTFYGNVFGGGSGYYPTLINNEVHYIRTAGVVKGNTRVEITGGHILTSVYGGCETTDVLGDTYISMSGGTLGVPRDNDTIAAHPVTCYLFGSGKGNPDFYFNTWTNVQNAHIDISGGHIFGSVFGGGEEGHVLGNVKINIHDDDDSSNPIPLIGCDGTSYVDGNVFGGGRGFTGWALTAGTVCGNIEVNVSNGIIRGSIYGGGRLGSVGTYLVPVTDPNYGKLQPGEDHGYITINVSGGTIGNMDEGNNEHTYSGNVFGGCMGRFIEKTGDDYPIWPSLARAKATEVNISNEDSSVPTIIKASVFGGGQLGTVRDSTVVNISGGTIGKGYGTPGSEGYYQFGSVYGGGQGLLQTTQIDEDYYAEQFSTQNDSLKPTIYLAGRVYGNATVNISGGQIMENVFGGGELASVGLEDTLKSGNTITDILPRGNTGISTVRVSGGEIGPLDMTGYNAYVYGGSEGKANDCGNVYRQYCNVNQAVLEISNTARIYGSIFGGGSDGHVLGDANITVKDDGVIIGTNGTTSWDGNIFGGGRNFSAAGADDAVCDIATAGRVRGNITINMSGGHLKGNIFGGGRMGSTGIDMNATDTIAGSANGHVFVNISGGEVGTNVDTITIGHVYGGAKGKMNDNDRYGRAKDTHVTISGSTTRIYGSVFGGSENGLVYHDTHVNIEGGIIGKANGYGEDYNMIRGNVYGGGRGVDDSHTVDDPEVIIDKMAGLVRGNTYVDVSGGTIYNCVFGGGSLANVGQTTYDGAGNITGITSGGNTNVIIRGGIIGIAEHSDAIIGDVFGAGRGETGTMYVNSNFVKNANVTIQAGAYIRGNVFGSGFNGHVYKDTYVTMTGGVVGEVGSTTTGNLLGGGEGSLFSITAGEVRGSTHVNITNGTVKYNVFGGGLTASVLDSTYVTVGGYATIGAAGYAGGGNIFGGGRGDHAYPTFAKIGKSTVVTVEGANVNVASNVYGGGKQGAVGQKSNVRIFGANINNYVYGAGKGEYSPTHDPTPNADVAVGTSVLMTSGHVLGAIYGGGENGSVGIPNTSKDKDACEGTLVEITGGTVGVVGEEDQGRVFGGGSYGFVDGPTLVNISGNPVFYGHVFAGAFGLRDNVYISGRRTANIRGGHFYGGIFGGSRNADDALAFYNGTTFTHESFATSTEIRPVSVVNMSGGHAYYRVYASGYFGHVFGSTYALLGTNAIVNSTYSVTGNSADTIAYFNDHNQLIIDQDVFAGGDFGTFNGSEFSTPTITGRAAIYIDGRGYNTIAATPESANNTYFNIGGSLYASGTSCDGGEQGSNIYVRNYGHDVASKDDPYHEPYSNATRSLYSIQRGDSLIIDNSHLNLLGQGKISSLITTEKYTIHRFDSIVRVVNGSSVFIDFPMEEVHKLGSYTCDSVYDLSKPYNTINYDGLGAAGSVTDNKIRINNGTYLMVRDHLLKYGELQGFFHMMTDDMNRVYAYARPKQSAVSGNSIPNEYDNQYDGGFVSYNAEYNKYSAAGGTVASGGVQMPYENHTPGMTKNGEDYFRIWRYSENMIHSYREGVFNALADVDHPDGYQTVDVVIDLPPARAGAYYRFKSEYSSAYIDYGNDIQTVNAGWYQNEGAVSSDNYWMYFNGTAPTGFVTGQSEDQATISTNLGYIQQAKSNRFGLVAIPEGSFNTEADTVLINPDADEYLADVVRWYHDPTELSTNPQIRFRLTYSNSVTGNFVWDPIRITMEQVIPTGEGDAVEVVDEVDIDLVITTSSRIDQNVYTKCYAMMQGIGTPEDSYTAKVVLPMFSLYVNEQGEYSKWTVLDVEWDPDETFTSAHGAAVYHANDPANYEDKDKDFAMTISAAKNHDNTLGWISSYHEALDLYPYYADVPNNPDPTQMGTVDGRSPFSFDFTIHYDGSQKVNTTEKMGTVKVKMRFTNFIDGTGDDHAEEVWINVDVYRRGGGEKFYIDGVNGSNYCSGRYPNAAKNSLSGVLYFTSAPEYLPGDTIYIVNTVTTKSDRTLKWYGQDYGQIVLIRYPGGHKLSDESDATVLLYDNYLTDPNYEEDGKKNPPFRGPLVNVTKSMNMASIILDGAYRMEAHAGVPDNLSTYPDFDSPPDHVEADTAMITVEAGGTLYMYNNSCLKYNCNRTTNGGAVWVDGPDPDNMLVGGKLYMNENDTINNNMVTSGQGGGIYLTEGSTLVLSDMVTVKDNARVTSKSTVDNNVYLPTYATVMQVGTEAPNDNYVALDPRAKVGVTKTAWGGSYPQNDRLPVVFSDNGYTYLKDLNEALIVYDDRKEYLLERLDTVSHQYLYFVKTWLNEVGNTAPSGFTNFNDIKTAEGLAWAIKYVNGTLDGAVVPHLDQDINITADIDMSAHRWVPMGNTNTPYTGTFDGQLHLIKGINSDLSPNNFGVIGYAGDDAIIKNVVVSTNVVSGADTIGSVVGTFAGDTLMYCEAAGQLTSDEYTKYMGSVVGHIKSGLVHSVFSVDTLNFGGTAYAGGLAGLNSADLYNSYSNTVINAISGIRAGGLVGENTGNVENCYYDGFKITAASNPFAHLNRTGANIKYCYAPNGTTTFVEHNDGTMTGYGTYETYASEAVFDIKALGYMYDDNKLTITSGTNTYYSDAITYSGGKIDNWPGMLGALNKWVRTKNTDVGSAVYTTWYRPTTYHINSDLPILGFRTASSLGTSNADGRVLSYNGLDNLLTSLNANNEDASLFHYGVAKEVVQSPISKVKVFVNEDAVLLRNASSEDDFEATVGITFDNSCRTAVDYYGNLLEYDWHLMATPLSNASMGTSYNTTTATMAYSAPNNLEAMYNGYFPNGLSTGTEDLPHWDFYTYYEPQYHWINFKRSGENHWHYDAPHGQIHYNGGGLPDTNEDEFIPGRGYMMAISQDSYLSNSGKLNTGEVRIPITAQAPSAPEYDRGSNLVGNPYQAYLDLDAVSTTTGFDEFYTYDADQGVYAPYTKTASENPVIPSQFIHPHQGFFVIASSNSTMTFTQDMATDESTATSFFRKKKNYPVVNIFAENTQGNRDLAVIELGRPELGGVNKVTNLKNADFQVYAHYNDENYGLLFTPINADRVPLFFKTSTDDTYTLRWSTYNGNFSTLYLIDNITGAHYDMLTHDHYTFTGLATDYAARFYIVFGFNDVEEYEDTENNDSFVYYDGFDWIVEGEGDMELFDLNGQLLLTKRLTSTVNRIELKPFASGTYFVRVIGANKVKTQKIVIR